MNIFISAEIVVSTVDFQLPVSNNQDFADKVLLGIKVYMEVNFMLKFPSNCYGGILIYLKCSCTVKKKILEQVCKFVRSYFKQTPENLETDPNVSKFV